MTLECTITGISQEMDFDKNEMLTYVGLRLPDGTLLRAGIDETAASTIMTLQLAAKGAPKAAAHTGPVPQPAPPAPRAPLPYENLPLSDDATSEDEFVTTPNEDGTETHVFGGQGDVPPSDASPEDPVDPAVADYEEPPAPAPPRQTPNSQTKPRVQRAANGRIVTPRARTVPAGEGGYPVVANAGVDTTELTSGRNQDEDGVGSV